MTSAYNTFKSFMQNLVKIEAIERNCTDREGYRKHYSIDDDTLATLQSLAADVVNSEDVDDVNDLQREVVAFVLHVNVCEFNHFLQNLNARYYAHEIFYPQCVGEYCYKKFPVAEWVAETFATDDVEDDAEEEAVETKEQEKISPERAALCSRAAMNLMNALNRRDATILSISRPGDEPLTVYVDDLLSLASFDDRVDLIATANDETAETVEKCLATGRLSFFDDPDDDDDDDSDKGDEREEEETTEAPRWLRRLRGEFIDAAVRIETARRREDDRLAGMIRADAMDSFLHEASEHDLTLTAWYLDDSDDLSRAIASLFDAIDAPRAVDDDTSEAPQLVYRRAPLNHKRHLAAIRFLAKTSAETDALLFEAIAEGLKPNARIDGVISLV